MNEMLLQFIWQYRLYNPASLRTTQGDPIVVVHPGVRNTDAGPDFEAARVKVGKETLVGNVELHVRTSDWYRHAHTSDLRYSNLILHVVYEDDVAEEILPFAKLVLGSHIPAYVIDQYTNLIQTTHAIPCAAQLPKVSSISKEAWLNRLLAERWETKLSEWRDLLSASAGDWRNLLYWRMAANFGFKVNAAPFLMLAQATPLNVLARHKDNLFQIEALLFGQAGMLEGSFREVYPNELKKEYEYLSTKYKLHSIPVHIWKFMRMRPPNFPTVRIAQFAALVHRSVHLFAQLAERASVQEIVELLQVSASSYWTTHYRFDEEHTRPYVKALGADSVDNLIVNTVAPIQFLYAHYHGHTSQQEAAIDLLAALAADHNNITSLWAKHGWQPENAAQSQALIQLFNKYCSSKRCLECAVGLSIIRSNANRT